MEGWAIKGRRKGEKERIRVWEGGEREMARRKKPREDNDHGFHAAIQSLQFNCLSKPSLN